MDQALEEPSESRAERWVWIFRTSVQDEAEALRLRSGLDALAPEGHWNFDLEDCDKILRIETSADVRTETKELLRNSGFHCEELEG
ncbi:MAG: hypothetical protein WD077_00955 [Bacteroidia bacterium]